MEKKLSPTSSSVIATTIQNLQQNSLDSSNNNPKISDSNDEPQNENENSDKWQILEGLKDGQRFEEKPVSFSGYMLKRRKRPLKGWHKRYFHLENGILSYSKRASDMTKKKLNGSTDIGLSVISCKPSSKRIDIDSDAGIYHLKAKKTFKEWIGALKAHRLSRQHEISYGNQQSQLNNYEFCDKFTSFHKKRSFSSRSDKLSSELLNYPIEATTKIQEKLIKLTSLLKNFEDNSDTSSAVFDIDNFKYKKSRLRFNLRRKKTGSSMKKDERSLYDFKKDSFDGKKLMEQSFLSHSHPSLTEEDLKKIDAESGYSGDSEKPISKDSAMHEFVQLANEINNNFRQLLKTIQEQEQIRMENTLQEKSFRNSFDAFSDNNEISCNGPSFNRTFSIDEQSISISEYHDAEDKIINSDYNSSSSSVEDEDDESVTDFSEDNHSNFEQKIDKLVNIERRKTLPTPQPTNDISLWSLLCKNIGKDLSKISMPVTINEPLNVLQRLCEELEYCELLDMAATMDNPNQRMLMVAAFAISSYCSSYYRVGHKPFNPLLGETYESVREDKGFRFISEQVSHHPPVSACHAESKNYTFWQDMRVKTKFWGKSMEIIPMGIVNVMLKPFNCHYKWNKITTCVHNLFKGERCVDIYGELTITDSNQLTCKITFEKAGYWSGKSNEIHGHITNQRGDVVEKICGKWNESIFSGSRCIWRAGIMPENYGLFYGFSRFATELNELTEAEKPWLPPTDTRFRPDQRLLEEGNVNRAEQIKSELEQSQRERRKEKELAGLPEYTPLWFTRRMEKDGEVFVFNDRYWESRENKFDGIEFVQLWQPINVDSKNGF